VVLTPSNPTMSPMVFRPDEVDLYGKVVTVVRRM
jgi:SOS-response transcriptional repressor LexA